MPLYDYQCKSCDHKFTELKKIDSRKEPESRPCPKCGENSVFHAIQPVKFHADVLPKNHKGHGKFKEVMENVKHHHPLHNID